MTTTIEPTRLVGKRVPRLDAIDKVTGKGQYGADQHPGGMLYAKVLRSPIPHGIIKRLDTSRAEALEGVRAVVTAGDVPDVKFGVTVMDEGVFAIDRVRYLGEAIAAVAATSERTAEEALKLIEVEFEELPVVEDIADALRPDAPLVHPDWKKYDAYPDLLREGNICSHSIVRRGDVEKGFAEAELVVEDEFETHMVHQGYIEPRAGVAWVDANGHVSVAASTQNPFNIRATLAKILRLPLNKVRVKATLIGGGFGGKLDPGVEHFTAVLAQKTGRPVRLVWTREEEMLAAAPRMPSRSRIKTGVMNDGTIVARKAEVWVDAGGYAGDSPVIATVTTMMAAGPYKIPNLELHGYAVYTNKANAGAYRGPGGPQTVFAVESQMDIIAEKLGMDPLELRLKNIVHDGDLGPTGQVLTHVGLEEAIRRVAECIDWKSRKTGPYRGVGMACSWWTTTAGSACAYVKLNEDGTIGLITGATEIGSGAVTAGVAQILAEEMGVDMEDLVLVTADTDATPYDFGAQGSRTVFNVGNAVRRAAEDCKRQILEAASTVLEAPVEELELRDKHVWVKGSAERRVSLAQIGEMSIWAMAPGHVVGKAPEQGSWAGGAIIGRGTFLATPTEYDASSVQSHMYPAFNAPTFYCHAAEVEVDPLTGEVQVLRYVAAHDVGKAINPEYIEGQFRGGAAQGLGYALSEEIVYKGGRVLNPNLTDYKMPTALDVPDIECIIVEAGSDEGPYGAKGVGEPSVIPSGALIANAVAAATGVRIRRLPLTAERVYRALQAHAAGAGKGD